MGPREKVEAKKVMRQAAAWYHEALLATPAAQEALVRLGLTDVSLYTDFRIGLCNGTLKGTVPSRGELHASLKQAGILAKDGKEFFEGCFVFPWFTEDDECLGMWGYPMDSLKGEARYLPTADHMGVYNFPALKRSRSIILTDSILRALFLYQSGYKDVVPMWWKAGLSVNGVKPLTDDHLRLFQRFGTKEAVVTFEDEATRAKLHGEGIKTTVVKLPEMPCPVAEIEKALRNVSQETVAVESPIPEGQGYEETETGFAVGFGGRRYEVKGLEKNGVRLKASVKAYRKAEPRRFFLDAVDLYSHRSRLLFAKGACGYFGEQEEALAQDLEKLIELSERFTPKGKAVVAPKAMTEKDKAEALVLLKDPNLLKRILEDFETCGLAGEEANKMVGYLAAVSRKLDDPLAVLIQSRSAAGKSTLQEAILRFVPPEDVEKYTRLTGQALFYKDEGGLCHKLIAIEEEAGAREASYSIRNLQSAKFLSIGTTEKDTVTGKMKAVEYQVKGPVALILTTTSVDMDYETQNRFITLTIDESPAMTERILARQRELETLEGIARRMVQEGVSAVHQNAQRLLRPLKVVNPYALKLTFPANTLRARRDHKKYLGLIRAVAFLHQYQRETKTHELPGGGVVEYIEVIPSDIEQANRLAKEVLGQTMGELSAPGRALLGKVRDMVKDRANGKKTHRFTRRDIRDFSGWSDFQVKTHIKELTDLEYLWSVTGKKGKEYVYELRVSDPRANGSGGPEDTEEGQPSLSGLALPEAG